MPKLYEVTVETSLFVMAESEEEACETAEEGVRQTDPMFDYHAREVTHRHWPRPADWGNDDLVYGTKVDTKLGDVLAALPEDERLTKLLRKKEG